MDRRLLVITAKAPASVANLGAGYDCLALALELHNHFRLYCDLRDLAPGEKEYDFHLTGTYAGTDTRMNSKDGNLFAVAFDQVRAYLCEQAGYRVPRCPLYVSQQVNIAPIRGLGSSSTASVAGILAGIRFVEAVYPELRPNDLLAAIPAFQHSNLNDIIASLAMAVDTCPDNICASLSGGLTYSFYDEEVPLDTCRLLYFFSEPVEDPDLRCLALIPSYQLQTPDAREFLQGIQYRVEDVAFNISRSTCLPAVLRDKRYGLLRAVTQDKIHQSQRARQFYKGKRKEINLASIFQEVLDAGAYATFIGGSGSALIALVDVAKAETAKERFLWAFKKAAAAAATNWEVDELLNLRINNQGAEWWVREGERDDYKVVKPWLDKIGADWVPLSLGPKEERMVVPPKIPDSLVLEAVRKLKRVSLREYTVVGKYRRYDEQARNTLLEWRKRIERPLVSPNRSSANFLIWAASGNGKSFFLQEIGSSNAGRLRYFELNLAKLNWEQFKEELAEVRACSEPTLCFLDEIDARTDEAWPYQECFSDLDLVENSGRAIVFVLVGSRQGGMEAMVEAMMKAHRGPDLLTRIPSRNRFQIPSLTLEDRAVVILSKLVSASAKQGRQIRQVEQLALYYVLNDPEMSDLRQLRDLASAVISRISDSDDRLKFDDMFAKGDEHLAHEFWAANEQLARELSNKYVTIED